MTQRGDKKEMSLFAWSGRLPKKAVDNLAEGAYNNLQAYNNQTSDGEK